MTLQARYKEYLANPTADAFADDATLNYVPTTTSLTKPSTILKHLDTQHRQVEKKAENFLNVIEGSNSICVETETALHFVQGGGVYLLNLDDNFLVDRTVTLPITHIVIFNDDLKIQQIRLLWDQACLLKAVETIGARGRNWPIRDGKEQIKMIASLAVAAPTLTKDDNRTGRRSTKGSQGSLSLFAPKEVEERDDSRRNSVAPRASAKPAPRDYGDLFVGSETQELSERSPSPHKRDRENSNPLKAGAGKNFQAPRLFQKDAEDETAQPEKGIKTNAQKYNHFEFGDAEATPKATTLASRTKTNHGSQWGFEDFSTPEKPRTRNFPGNQPSFKWDAESEAANKTPVFTQAIPKPRPDANAHFSFEDQTPKPERTYSNRPPSSASSGGLYEDHILGAYHTSQNRNTVGNGNGAETDDGFDDHRPLKTITNPNSHNVSGKGRGPKPSDRQWDMFSDAPVEKQRGIKIQGDGMGKRKHGEKEWWDYEGEEQDAK